MRLHPLLGAAALIVAVGCRTERAGESGEVALAGKTKPAAEAFDPAAWQPPPESAIPADSLGASIRRGLALVLHTNDSLPRYAPGQITCGNCHLSAGRNAEAAPFAGAHARFPKYMERTGAVIGLADRVNYCFTRSLAGSRLPVDSREMQDILAYIAWLSSGVPVGEGKKLPGADGILAMAKHLDGDTARGRATYAAKCVACHGTDGAGGIPVPTPEGSTRVPALWGPKSFSVGASMARRDKAASFIWHNMPFGQAKTLTEQEAFDVAAYIDSKPRPDSPGKENDWPLGGAPADVPYATQGHEAFAPPPLLARRNAAEAIVPKPAPVKRGEVQR